jgi:HAMP domain-containing protein
VLAALAVLAGVILGQQVTGPLGTLSDAVGKLGQGDFSTSIPSGGTQEVGKLARTIETMRDNLVQLTGELRRREARRKRCSAASSKVFTQSTSHASFVT